MTISENNVSFNRINASIISGIIEVGATHPIDYMKTLFQKNESKINTSQIKNYMKTPYKGVGSRLIGVVPMRILFWNSLDYFKSKGYTIIRNAISNDVADFLYQYFLLRRTNTDIMFKTTYISNLESSFGVWNDRQAPDTFSIYGDNTFDTLF